MCMSIATLRIRTLVCSNAQLYELVSIFDCRYYRPAPSGPFPLSGEPAENHDSCINQHTRQVPDD